MASAACSMTPSPTWWRTSSSSRSGWMRMDTDGWCLGIQRAHKRDGAMTSAWKSSRRGPCMSRTRTWISRMSWTSASSPGPG
eukprot:2937404-Lingulodinium_polyedra.AAC.1